MTTPIPIIIPVAGMAENTDILRQFRLLNTNIFIGTTTNDNAAAGYIGEYIESLITAVNFPTSTQYGDATSISLTAGDWDVSFVALGALIGGTFTEFSMGISTTTGNSTTGLVQGNNWLNALVPGTATLNGTGTIAEYRMSLSATTTVYAKYEATWTVTAPKMYGRISARRRR